MNKQKLEKWIASLSRIQNEVFSLLENKKRFNALVEKNNKKELEGELWDFIKINYAGNITMSICRQVDDHKDAVSLLNLLEDVLENAHTIPTSWLLEQWPEGKEEEPFKLLFSDSDHLVVKNVCSDITELKRITEAISNHRDKRIAHSDKKQVIPIEPEFNDIEKSVDFMEALFKKYYYLLKQSSHTFSL